jgi:hypothetical protein
MRSLAKIIFVKRVESPDSKTPEPVQIEKTRPTVFGKMNDLNDSKVLQLPRRLDATQR